MRSKLYKKPEAVDHATAAYKLMEQAMYGLNQAVVRLNNSGYRRAGVGVMQANKRVADWMKKVYAEIEARRPV